MQIQIGKSFSRSELNNEKQIFYVFNCSEKKEKRKSKSFNLIEGELGSIFALQLNLKQLC